MVTRHRRRATGDLVRAAATAAAWAFIAVSQSPALARADVAGQPSTEPPSEPPSEPLSEPYLNARRRYRGVTPRVFQKTLRHELSVLGGIYAADVLSASYLVGAAYTFHLSETFGIELQLDYGQEDSQLVADAEVASGVGLRQPTGELWIYQAHVVWSLGYGKIRWSGGGISRFDLRLVLGGGLTDALSARGLTGSAGLGFSIYLTSWFGLRFDVRDHVLAQEVLGRTSIVNNLVATLGCSTFLPFGF